MALQHLRSSTAHKRPIPTVMSAGQIAVNTNEASPGLFFKDSNGDLVKVGPVHIGPTAPNSSPASVAATALVTGTVYQILTVGTSDFTLVGASANTVGTIFTATGTTTGTGTVSGQQGVEKGEQWLDNSGGTYVLKIYDGTDWRSESGTFVDVSGDTMTGDLVMNNANIVFEGATADDFETTLTVTDPTADRTITLPNVTGTVVTTGDTGTVTSTMIADGTIVNADINASAAIAGTKIDPDFGSQTIETTGVFSAADGAAATPSITFTGDTNTGIYRPGADQVAISTNGTGRLFIDSSGNVGIGGIPPTSSNAAGYREFLVKGSSTNRTGVLRLQDGAGTDAVAIYANEVNGAEFRQELARPITFWTNATERLRIDSSGSLNIKGAGTAGVTQAVHFNGSAPVNSLVVNSSGSVGIGTSSPDGELDVTGTGDANGGVLVVNDAGVIGVEVVSPQPTILLNETDTTDENYQVRLDSGDLLIQTQTDARTGASTKVTIDSSGQVSIGSATSALASQRLTINYDTGSSTFSECQLLRIDGPGAAGEIGGIGFSYRNSSNIGEKPSAFIGNIIDSNSGGKSSHLVFATRGATTDTEPLERMRIDSSGNVGIGTSSPSELLHVKAPSGSHARIRLEGGSGGYGGILDLRAETTGSGTDAAGRIRYFMGQSSQIAEISGQRGINEYYGTLAFQTANNGSLATRLFISSSGNVGIGTTSPTAPLSFADTVGTAGDINKVSLYSNGGVPIYGFGSSAGQLDYVSGNHHVFYRRVGTTSTEKARLDSSGRLLVGTSSALTVGDAQHLFQVESVSATPHGGSFVRHGGTSAAAGAAITLGRSRGTSAGDVNAVNNGDTLGYIIFSGSNGTNFSNNAAWIKCEVDAEPFSSGDTSDLPGRLVFSVTADGSASPSEAMRINNAGELLVGYTSDNGAYKLQVNSQIFATSATIATSDGRYKENVASLDGCVDLVKALRPVSFDWKAQEPITRVDEDGETVVVREAHNFPDGKQVGFIAQEVEEVLADKPWLGSVIKQNVRPAVTDNDGNKLAPEEEFLGIAEGNLVAVLTSALKDAIGRIESLEAEVAALKA